MALLSITTKKVMVTQPLLNLNKVTTPKYNLLGGGLFKGARLMFAPVASSGSNGAGFYWR